MAASLPPSPALFRWAFSLPCTLASSPGAITSNARRDIVHDGHCFPDRRIGQQPAAEYQIDAHLTRDFTEHLWGSLDAAWYNGAKATIEGVKGDKLDNYGFGLTVGYQINDNLGLTFSYKSTASDQAPDDLQMDVFMISLVSGWHPLIEGAKLLKSE